MPQKYKTNLPILYVSCDTPEHVPYNQIHISGVSDSYYAKKTTSYNVEARFSIHLLQLYYFMKMLHLYDWIRIHHYNGLSKW